MNTVSSGRSAGRMLIVALPCVAALLLDTGCVSSGETVWGSHVTAAGAGPRLFEAMKDAATTPRVWVPLASAAVLQINGWDRKVSNWARTNTPLFGSQSNAARWSNDLRSLSTWSYIASAVATPGADDPQDWMRAKAKGVAVGLGAVAAANLTTSILKKAVARERPYGGNTESFPSGHTSHSAVTTEMARFNLTDIEMADTTRRVLGVGLDALTVGTAWARVETGAHFPADTLVSIAIGNYFGQVFDNAFLGNGSGDHRTLALVPVEHGAELEWTMTF